jgi:hypothetical protein
VEVAFAESRWCCTQRTVRINGEVVKYSSGGLTAASQANGARSHRPRTTSAYRRGATIPQACRLPLQRGRYLDDALLGAPRSARMPLPPRHRVKGGILSAPTAGRRTVERRRSAVHVRRPLWQQALEHIETRRMRSCCGVLTGARAPPTTYSTYSRAWRRSTLSRLGTSCPAATSSSSQTRDTAQHVGALSD